MGKIPIIGEKQKALAVFVETSHGKGPGLGSEELWKNLVYCSIMRVRHGTYVSFRFVKNCVERFLGNQGDSLKANSFIRRNEGSRKKDSLSFYRNRSFFYQSFYGTPRSHPTGSEKFVEPHFLLECHDVLLFFFLEFLEGREIRNRVYAKYFKKKVRSSIEKRVSRPLPPSCDTYQAKAQKSIHYPITANVSDFLNFPSGYRLIVSNDCKGFQGSFADPKLFFPRLNPEFFHHIVMFRGRNYLPSSPKPDYAEGVSPLIMLLEIFEKGHDPASLLLHQSGDSFFRKGFRRGEEKCLQSM
jgi:hypothetical protein